MTNTAQICGMCDKRELEEVERKGGIFLMCPNCDHPQGKAPERKAE